MIVLDVKCTGPLFTVAIAPKVEQTLDQVLQELVEKGEERLGQLLQKAPTGVYLSDGKSTGHYRRNIHGELRPDHSALITDSGVVYGPFLEFGRGRFRGYHVFRQVGDWLSEEAPAVAEKYVAKLARELS
jgi:hypothetical protein